MYRKPVGPTKRRNDFVKKMLRFHPVSCLSLVMALSVVADSFAPFKYSRPYTGNPAQRPYDPTCTSGLTYQQSTQLRREFVLVCYQNGTKMKQLEPSALPVHVDHVLLVFTGYDRTPDGMLGDTSGDLDNRGVPADTQPLFILWVLYNKASVTNPHPNDAAILWC